MGIWPKYQKLLTFKVTATLRDKWNEMKWKKNKKQDDSSWKEREKPQGGFSQQEAPSRLTIYDWLTDWMTVDRMTF